MQEASLACEKCQLKEQPMEMISINPSWMKFEDPMWMNRNMPTWMVGTNPLWMRFVKPMWMNKKMPTWMFQFAEPPKKKAKRRRSSSVPTTIIVEDETELMQREVVLQEKNYLEYKNDASMFHMAMENDMEEEVYTNSYFKKNLHAMVYYSLDLYRWLSVFANSSFYTMVFPERTNRNDCLDHFLLSSCLSLKKKRAASQTCFEKEGSFVQEWH